MIDMSEQVPISGYKLFGDVVDLLMPDVGHLTSVERDRQLLLCVKDSVFAIEILEEVLELAQDSSHIDVDLLAFLD